MRAADTMEHPPGPPGVRVDDWFVRDLPELTESVVATTWPDPRLVALDDDLATQLGLDPQVLRSGDGVAMLAGNRVPEGATPVAQGYSGHQFGGYSPRLGDGRAVLLGEVVTPGGDHVDLHLKGTGPTSFARGGDGYAALGPMLREYLIGRAMHALGVRTARPLAVVATGGSVVRERLLPGAVLARTASSHLRVGTFQYAAALGGPDLVRRVADHAIARHHPGLAERPDRYLALYEAVLAAQADLVAHWMTVGFIHGVMNTDNTTISGETIDYGPCAFMDAFDPSTVFSSIDHGGRYAYGNQPSIAQWNLARLAETMLGLFDDDTDTAVEVATGVLSSFQDRYTEAWFGRMRPKVGLGEAHDGDRELIIDLIGLMAEHEVDLTAGMRSLSAAVAGDRTAAHRRFGDAAAFDEWADRWVLLVGREGRDPADVAASMDRVNPVYVPRNHLVEAALEAATEGDLGPFRQLDELLADPFTERSGLDDHAEPAPPDAGPYRTFCGT